MATVVVRVPLRADLEVDSTVDDLARKTAEGLCAGEVTDFKLVRRELGKTGYDEVVYEGTGEPKET